MGVRFRDGFQDLRCSGAGAWGGLMSCEPGLSPSWGTQRQLSLSGWGEGRGVPGDRWTRQHPLACGTRTQHPLVPACADPGPVGPLGTGHQGSSAGTQWGKRVAAEPGLLWKGANRGRWGWRRGQWVLSAGSPPSWSRNSSPDPTPRGNLWRTPLPPGWA